LGESQTKVCKRINCVKRLKKRDSNFGGRFLCMLDPVRDDTGIICERIDNGGREGCIYGT
jgi:hypothetical protein